MSLKTAYDIACGRFGHVPAPHREMQDDARDEPPAVVMERDSIVFDPDNQPEDPDSDFFVKDSPSKVRGSRAVSNREKTAAADGPAIRRTKGLNVIYEGPLLSFSGFSKMNRAVVSGLVEAGVSVRVVPVETKVDVDGREKAAVEGLYDTRVPAGTAKVYGMTVPSTTGHSGRRVLYTMMETSGGVHPDYVGKLNLTNEVWVPSSYLVDVLLKSGVHADIYEMPLGVDTSFYRPGVKPMKLGRNVKGFVFLSVFNWGFRKGWDILLKAYLEEFSSQDDTTLLMSVKSFGNPRGTDEIMSQIASFKAGIRKHPAEMPSMVLHTAGVEEKDMPSLYSAADAFVLFSRGEGMGLPYLEAGACGLPVIASNCTAQGTFLNDSNSYLVDPDSYTVHRVADSAFGNMARQCHFYDGQLFPKFGSTAIGRARECMREVYEGLGEARKKGEQLRRDICSGLTWNHAINRITSRLEDMR